MSEIAPDVPEEAVARNQQALRKHTAGDYEGAAAELAKLVAERPGYDRARYNLACALARQGEIEDAATEIELLLTRDLPSFLHRWPTDEDLQELKTSPEGERLAALGRERLAAWTAAIATGLPAMARVAGAWRVGVYLHGSRRFLPVAAWQTQVLGGGVDLAGGRAFQIRSATWEGDDESVLSGWRLLLRTKVEVYSLETLQRTTEKALSGENEFDDALSWLSVTPLADGLLVRWSDPGAEEDDAAVRLLPDGTTKPAGAEAKATGAELRVSPDELTLLDAGPEGVVLRGNALELADRVDPVQLGRGHAASGWHSLVASPNGGRFVAVVSLKPCGGDEAAVDAAPLRHFADLVDTTTGAVRRLGEGDGWAATAFGSDGALWFQEGAALRRFADPGVEASEEALAGVVLAPPHFERICDEDELGV